MGAGMVLIPGNRRDMDVALESLHKNLLLLYRNGDSLDVDVLLLYGPVYKHLEARTLLGPRGTECRPQIEGCQLYPGYSMRLWIDRKSAEAELQQLNIST